MVRSPGIHVEPAEGLLPIGLIDEAEPVPVRVIFDVETMRVVADPLRARILETMGGRPTGSWSVHELADAIEVPQTRLYHHIDMLVRHHLIRAVERRIVSRIVETRYRVAAHSIQLDPAMFATGQGSPQAGSGATIGAAFDDARSEVEDAVQRGLVEVADDAPAERRMVLDRVVMTLTPERAAELHERLFEIADEFGDDAAPGGVRTGMLLALYPMSAEPRTHHG